MKTFLVLRHAKSDRSNSALRDHDRPLAPRGEADAPRMGTALAALGLILDCIVTSTAVRARDTTRLVAAAMGYGGEIIEEPDLYGASVDTLLAVVRECADETATALLVGHNPGLEELVCLLTGGEDAEAMLRLPTAGLACIALDIDDWSRAGPACGLLQWFLIPRIVSPLLHAARDAAVQ
ncbi:MAG: SixA phosphatase family protein [Thermomicrobiales bacterium]